jgi:prepilin-type N-terminal cleavage/methylation domain-containing protein
MKFSKLGLVNKSQKGMTMLELLVAFAVTGIISGGITTTLYQMVTGSARTNNHMMAVKQVQNAGYWVSRDAQAAQSVAVDEGEATGFPLTLAWTDWDDTENTVTYTLVGTELWRDDGVQQSAVAQFVDVDPAQTSCDFADTNGDEVEDTVIFRVTVTIGSGLQQETETREYRIVPRPLW